MRVKQRWIDASAIGPNTPICEKLNPNPNTPCPNSPNAITVSSKRAIIT